MISPNTSVRPFSSEADYERMIDYFHGADDDSLRAMGVERGRLPSREIWLARLLPDLGRPPREKLSSHLAWYLDDQAVGHSSANKIVFGESAYLHLHLWNAGLRHAGLGLTFFNSSVRHFATELALRQVVCEPYAENQAPNRILEKAGFRFVRRYRTTPGPLNFEQDVNRWELEIPA